VRFLLERYPGFNFSKGFYDISTLSSATIDTQEGKLVQGPGFFWCAPLRRARRLLRRRLGESSWLPP